MKGRAVRKRYAFIIIAVLAVAMATAGVSVAWASSEGGEAPRRINTGNVNDAHEIVPIGEAAHEGEVKALEEPKDGEGSHDPKGPATEEGKAGHGDDAGGGEGAEEAHHPAWMIPGWQSIFTLFAVAYFALAVTILPRIMAKEEHH